MARSVGHSEVDWAARAPCGWAPPPGCTGPPTQSPWRSRTPASARKRRARRPPPRRTRQMRARPARRARRPARAPPRPPARRAWRRWCCTRCRSPARRAQGDAGCGGAGCGARRDRPAPGTGREPSRALWRRTVHKLARLWYTRHRQVKTGQRVSCFVLAQALPKLRRTVWVTPRWLPPRASARTAALLPARLAKRATARPAAPRRAPRGCAPWGRRCSRRSRTRRRRGRGRAHPGAACLEHARRPPPQRGSGAGWRRGARHTCAHVHGGPADGRCAPRERRRAAPGLPRGAPGALVAVAEHVIGGLHLDEARLGLLLAVRVLVCARRPSKDARCVHVHAHAPWDPA